MDAFATTVIAFAVISMTALLVWNAVYSLRVAIRQDGELPFFAMLRRRGLTPAGVEEAIGAAEAARAVRRCVFCKSNGACREHVAFDCPNTDVLDRAAQR